MFTVIVGCRKVVIEAASSYPTNGRSGGRGDPSVAPSRQTAPSWPREVTDAEEAKRQRSRQLHRPPSDRGTNFLREALSVLRYYLSWPRSSLLGLNHRMR
jgi:hypothetical protein